VSFYCLEIRTPLSFYRRIQSSSFDPSKPHPSRYTFILCRQKENTPSPKFAPDSLRQHYEGSPGELGKASQDIIDRMKFNTQHFIDQNHMQVVAASFMLVEGNMKSGFENAALTATAMAHKIVGK
jgi:hypothetical protein